MQHKKWLIQLSVVMLTIAAMIISFNYVIDPLQQFRISSFYPIHFDNSQQRYLNPGLAKNYPYTSVILGTSHTENFVLADIEHKLSFNKAINLSMAGASAHEESKLLQLILKHKHTVNVLYGLDVFVFSGNADRKDASFPEFLYADNIFFSLLYLLKFDTTLKSFAAIKKGFSNTHSISNRFKHMYETQQADKNSFGKELMLQHKGYHITDLQDYSFDVLKNSFEKNILPVIERDIHTKYIIFYPPYSILAYKRYHDKGILKDVLLFKKYLFETLQDLDNVHLYDFQIAKQITHNLDNYKDFTHYHQRVTVWILEQIKNNNYRVNKKNIEVYTAELLQQTENFNLQNQTEIKLNSN